MTLPFAPARGLTATAAPSASSVDVAYLIGATGSTLPCLLVSNAGTVVAFVRIQTTAGKVAASAADTPILPGQSRVLFVGYRDADYTVSVFATAATTVYLTPGDGGVW